MFPRVGAPTRRRLVQWWSGKLLRVVGVTVRAESRFPLEEGGVAIVAANHVSWLDIFVVSSVHPTRFIAKSEIRDWPLAGWIAERAGTLFIRRERRRDTARINDQVRAALDAGDCVGLFPEGTTSEGDALLRFHSSLFEPAVACGARVIPVALRFEHPDGTLCRSMAFAGELSFVQSLGLVIRQQGAVARITFGPMVVAGSGHGRREVARSVENHVANLLGLAPRDTEPNAPSDRRAAPR